MATLTLEEAQSVIAGSQAKMDEMGVKLTISVVDGRGDLIALARVDGASWRTPYISQGKAVASATWGLSSADMAARWSEPIFPGFMALQGGRFIPSQGALPIYKAASWSARRAVAAAPRRRTKTAFARASNQPGLRRAHNRKQGRGDRPVAPLSHPIRPVR